MSIDVRPVLSALLRSRTGAVLVSLQIALTLAIAVNAVYIAALRLERLHRPSGMDIANIFVVSSAGFTDRFNADASTSADLRYLRGLPGVIDASVMSGVPMSGNGRGEFFSTKPQGRGNGTAVSYTHLTLPTILLV